MSAKFHSGNFDAYGNLAVGQEKATNVVSNQYLFDNVTPLADLGGLTEFQYIQNHWIYTDHNQFVTASAGASYQFCGRASTPGEMWWDTLCGTTVSTDMVYGSGLRAGDANIGSEAPYAQFNASASHEFEMPDGKPLTVRFDVVNLFDTIYQIRSGTGIGVFAPQFGPRRGYFIGISKKISTPPGLFQISLYCLDQFFSTARALRILRRVDDVQPDVILDHFGHQAAERAACRHDQVQHAGAALIVRNCALDRLDLAAHAPHAI